MIFYTAIYSKISRHIGVQKRRIQTFWDLGISQWSFFFEQFFLHNFSDLLAQMVDANLFVPIVMRKTVPNLCDS